MPHRTYHNAEFQHMKRLKLSANEQSPRFESKDLYNNLKSPRTRPRPQL